MSISISVYKVSSFRFSEIEEYPKDEKTEAFVCRTLMIRFDNGEKKVLRFYGKKKENLEPENPKASKEEIDKLMNIAFVPDGGQNA